MAVNSEEATNFLLGTPGYFWDDNGTAITLGVLAEINDNGDSETVYYNAVGTENWFDNFSEFSEPMPVAVSIRLATLPIKIISNASV